jgi:hypothetical protein
MPQFRLAVRVIFLKVHAFGCRFIYVRSVPCRTMFQQLYGSTAAGLYDQAAKLNAQARTLYLQSSDTYYKANDAAAYDDWVRARAHWDYFYHRS